MKVVSAFWLWKVGASKKRKMLATQPKDNIHKNQLKGNIKPNLPAKEGLFSPLKMKRKENVFSL